MSGCTDATTATALVRGDTWYWGYIVTLPDGVEFSGTPLFTIKDDAGVVWASSDSAGGEGEPVKISVEAVAGFPATNLAERIVVFSVADSDTVNGPGAVHPRGRWLWNGAPRTVRFPKRTVEQGAR